MDRPVRDRWITVNAQIDNLPLTFYKRDSFSGEQNGEVPADPVPDS